MSIRTGRGRTQQEKLSIATRFGASAMALAGALTLAALLPASAAQAQTAATAANASDDASNGDIIVTAQFREQNVQRTPIAITAISAETLAARGQVSVVDIAAQAPNVNLQTNAPNGPSLQAHIRGIGQTDFNYAFEPGVGLYVDDVYYSTLTGSVLDLLDLERIEVLRGPQGTLAGMNSIGGSIKLYTKKPDGRNGGYVEATIGDYGRRDFRGSADFSIVPDRLAVRIAGVSRNQDGYVTRYDFACTHPTLAATYNIPSQAEGKNCKLGTEGGKSYIALRGSVRWTPSDRLEININGDVSKDNSEAAPQTLLYVGMTTATGYQAGTGSIAQTYPMWSTAATNGLTLWNAATQTSPFLSYSPWSGAGDTFTKSPYVNYATYANVKPIDGSPPYSVSPVSQVSGWGVSANIDYDLSEKLKLTSITAYRSYDADWVQDIDATNLSNAVLTYHTTNWQFSQELRLAASLFENKVDLVVGGFYIKRESTYSGTVDQGPIIFYENDSIPAKNWAAFANASWRITDKLELNGGIRYSEEEKTFNFGRGGRPGATAAPYFPCVVNGVNYGNVHVAFCGLNGAQGNYSGNNVDYRGILQYQWTPSVMTYASISTGFKGGGVNPRPYYPDQARPFDPETLTAYELGAKTSFFDRKLRLNVSAFVNKYKDFIASVFSRTATAPNTGCFFNTSELSCSFFVNAGKATLKGLELEVQAQPVRGFTIDGSASWLDFKYNSLSGCAVGVTPGCTAPAGGLGAGITYGMTLPYAPKRKFSLGAQYVIELGDIGSLTPRVDYSYQSMQEANTINNALAKIPAFSLVNAGLTWKSADEDWQLSAQVSNLTNELYYTGIGQSNNTAMVTGAPGAPRQWWLTLKRKF